MADRLFPDHTLCGSNKNIIALMIFTIISNEY